MSWPTASRPGRREDRAPPAGGRPQALGAASADDRSDPAVQRSQTPGRTRCIRAGATGTLRWRWSRHRAPGREARAIGCGSAVIISAVVTPIALSRMTTPRIRRNLFRAWLTHSLGVLITALGWLNPMITGAAMTVSSLSLGVNSSGLRGYREPETKRGDSNGFFWADWCFAEPLQGCDSMRQACSSAAPS